MFCILCLSYWAFHFLSNNLWWLKIIFIFWSTGNRFIILDKSMVSKADDCDKLGLFKDFTLAGWSRFSSNSNYIISSYDTNLPLFLSISFTLSFESCLSTPALGRVFFFWDSFSFKAWTRGSYLDKLWLIFST